jgi:hypothetical protein
MLFLWIRLTQYCSFVDITADNQHEWKWSDSKQPVDGTGPKFAVFVLHQYQEGITEKGCMFAESMVTNTAPKQRQTDSQFLHKKNPSIATTVDKEQEWKRCHSKHLVQVIGATVWFLFDGNQYSKKRKISNDFVVSSNYYGNEQQLH